ncbi:hypothetical protein BDV93DRAFT_21974 [Ceratobasidium sp. AG-I]|nr:hypothetical protein BDV93DRAFT_21974 [Ceratobasidium sp. AG-I]
MYSNRILSFLQPHYSLSSPLFIRGYATQRPSQSPKSSTKIPNAPPLPKRPHAEPKRSGPLPKSPPPPLMRPTCSSKRTSSSKRLPSWVKRRIRSKRSQSSLPPLPPPPPPEPVDMYSPCILIPAPTTPTELCNAMRHLIQSTTPHIPITRLISTHAQHTTLQSCTSFNIVLAHAIRVAPVPYFAELTTQMRLIGIAWDQTTEILAVRAHIQAGRWEEAIQHAERLWPLGGAPLDVFTELMHFVLTRKATQEETASDTQRAWKLFPADPNISLAEASPRLAYNVVRLLLRIGQNAQALQLTRRLLDSLDSSTPTNIRYCRAILRLILEVPEKPKTKPLPPPPIFHERQALLNSLLEQNPALSLTPDASIVRTLLENLYRARGRSSTALHVLAEMQSKYGPGVESSAVRRLIARYAIRDRKLDVAWEMYRRELQDRRSSAKEAKTMRRASWQQAQRGETEAPWAGEDHTPSQSHLEYIRSLGTDNVKWSIVERTLRRMDAKERHLVSKPKEAPVVEKPKALQSGERAPSKEPRPVSSGKSRVERVPVRHRRGHRRGKKTKKD